MYMVWCSEPVAPNICILKYTSIIRSIENINIATLFRIHLLSSIINIHSIYMGSVTVNRSFRMISNNKQIYRLDHIKLQIIFTLCNVKSLRKLIKSFNTQKVQFRWQSDKLNFGHNKYLP